MLIWKYREVATKREPGLALHPVIDRLLAVRGFSDRKETDTFLSPEYERDVHDPFLFSAMETVVERLGQARTEGETVGLFGDFDADGITSSAIMRSALDALSIPTFVYIPHKLDEGHGLSIKAIDAFLAARVRLILTLDCGMMNHAEIALAKERGLEVIIIDHHHVPEILPPALAIINPRLPNEQYPFRELCGAGTSFKVASALYERYLPEAVDQVKWLLDLAAIGTVADVMPLLGENRTIVKYGLIVLSKTRHVGLAEMFAVGRIPINEEEVPVARTIAFQIAPRLNAASRMAHPMLAHELLMESDRAKARTLALELETYNTARQKVSQETTKMVRKVATDQYQDKKFIFAVGPEYPLGVAGLVAGRIAHELGKPTAVCAMRESESTCSFRSIPGFNIIEALGECAPLLKKFGGHEQAAGMTIPNDRLDEFEERFAQIVSERLTGRETLPEIDIDLLIEPHDITLSLVRGLAQLEPFGEGNPEPVFALKKMTILEARTVGKDNQHWKLKLKNGGAPETFDAVGWSLVDTIPELVSGMQVDIAFQLSENTWNGRTAVQLKLLDVNLVGHVN